ncbi:MAG: nucleotide exchange factor GrpE [Pseudomonadota bacterium]
MSDTDETIPEEFEAGAEEAEAEEMTADGGEAEDPAREPTPEERIIELEAQTADLNDKLLRTLAEMDNIRKRAERQVAEARIYAVEKFAGDLLPVSDNLARALDVLDDAAREALSEAGLGLLGGVEMTQKELHAVLARHNVTAIDAAAGSAFDPNLHQAVSQIPSDQPSGTIAEPFQSGWKIGDRVLRAAMVAVSTGPAN